MKIIANKVQVTLLLFFLSTLLVSAAHSTIVQVFDEKGSPLPGVNVYTDDFSFSGNTNDKGEIQITVVNTDSDINFTFIGYENVEVPYRKLTQQGGKLFMIPTIHTLSTFVVQGRRDDALADASRKINIISLDRIQKSFSNTSADLLSREGGLFVQKSQLGGGSPIIRGFEANRVLLVVDGVRMNNAIYRNGHLQNSISIDPSMLQQVEVIYGPGSLTYGSDALGGVVHFRSKDPNLYFGNDKNFKTNVNFSSRFATATNSQVYHTDFNIGTKKWGFLTSLSYADFGDLKSGSNRPDDLDGFGQRTHYAQRSQDGKDELITNGNPDLQFGSGYKQYDLLQKIRFQPNNDLYFVLNLQLSNTTNIPRYDRLTESNGNGGLKFAEWYYGPQLRSMISLKTRILSPTLLFDRATIINAFQKIGEDRHDRRFDSDIRESSLVDLNIYSVTADFDKAIDRNHRHWLNYGVDFNHNDVFSSGFSTDITTNQIEYNLNARYPSSGSSLTALGAYANYRIRNLDSSFVFNAGLRYSHTSLFAQFSTTDPIQWPSNYIEGIHTNNNALTWATGLSYQSANHWTIKTSVGTAFRAPNVDDFAKFREKNGFLTIPNPDLKPEKAFSTELTIEKDALNVTIGDLTINRMTWSLTGFYTALQDAIVRTPFYLPNGSNTLLSYNETFFVQANQNTDFARIYGISTNLLIDFNPNWSLRSGINYTYGRRSLVIDDTNSGEATREILVPQDHIPPIYGQTALTYEKDKFNIEAIIRYNGQKKTEDYAVSSIEVDPSSPCGIVYNRTGTSDNIEQGVISNTVDNCGNLYQGIYGWTTFNLYTGYKINNRFSLNLGVENITDLHYREFASGISAPGRNFIFSLRGQF